MLRRTKIVATIGPGCDDPETLEKVLLAGVNVARLNFSHGSPDDHRRRAQQVRDIAAKHGIYVALLGDLQGPKIRISRFADGKISLTEGAKFTLDSEYDTEAGTQDIVGIDYKELPQDVETGDTLLLDDGRVQLRVLDVVGQKVHTEVILGSELSNNKGINKLGGGISAAALTEKDYEDIKLAAEIGVDYLAVSFPRDERDMHEAQTLVKAAGSTARLIAKIERAETVTDPELLDNIIIASDAVMVARGDLGVEIGDAQLIGVQKQIIKRARTLDRLVITATQMMESMIDAPVPTRAEVFDVANAVLDGTDAVMLSAETATGKYPVEVVETMSRLCIGAESNAISKISKHRVQEDFTTTDETIALSTMYAANHLKGVKAILCLTESGATPLWMSRIRTAIPIYVLTRHENTRNRVALFRGCEAIPYDATVVKRKDVNRLAVEQLSERGIVNDGDLVILTKGDHMGIHGGTNALKILVAGNVS
jgi:pyruvate kinase